MTVWGRTSRALLGVVALVVLIAVAPAARAELHIDLTHGQTQPMPIALPAFLGDGGNGQLGQQIVGVVANDLQSSGLFQIIDPHAYIQNVSAGGPPDFGAWRQINAQALVSGDVQTQSDGKSRVEFRLWDVYAGQQLAGFAYTTTPQNWRRIAHIIADEVYKRLTGEDGYFDSRIVYIAESGPAQNRIKRLAIMDQDGANNQYLTDGRALVLTPRFSPSMQAITYLSYASGVPRVFLYNIDTNQQESVGDFPGMTFAPRFSPDGNRVVLSKSEGGASNIYSLDLRTHHLTKLSDGGAIDTSPCFSPDGTKIAFNSDRGGTQQLYVMNADGSGVQRISFGSGRYATPVWSPRGDLIAFTKFGDGAGQFSIGVMHPDGSGERVLAQDFLVEGPTWAPNGRVLAYFRQTATSRNGQGGSSRLFSIDLTGTNQREVPTPGDASDPAWSPLLR